MQIFLAITLFFTVFVPSQSQSAEERAKLVNSVNQIRTGFTNGFGFPFVPLKWDDELALIVQHAPDDCVKIQHGREYRVFVLNGDENGKKLMKFQNNRLQKAENVDGLQSSLAETHSPVQLLNPIQTKIACAGKTCTGIMDEQFAQRVGMSGTRFSFRTICAVGPFESWETATVEKIVEENKRLNQMTTMAPNSATETEETIFDSIEAPKGPSAPPATDPKEPSEPSANVPKGRSAPTVSNANEPSAPSASDVSSAAKNTRLAASISAILLSLVSIMQFFL